MDMDRTASATVWEQMQKSKMHVSRSESQELASHSIRCGKRESRFGHSPLLLVYIAFIVCVGNRLSHLLSSVPAVQRIYNASDEKERTGGVPDIIVSTWERTELENMQGVPRRSLAGVPSFK